MPNVRDLVSCAVQGLVLVLPSVRPSDEGDLAYHAILGTLVCVSAFPEGTRAREGQIEEWDRAKVGVEG